MKIYILLYISNMANIYLYKTINEYEYTDFKVKAIEFQ